jgi:hypothetical protein
MSTLQSEIEDDITQLLRTTARQYGEALVQYGGTFAAYGRGEIDAREVAQRTLNMAIGEARRVVETDVGLGFSYAKWAASLVGIKNLSSQAEQAAERNSPEKDQQPTAAKPPAKEQQPTAAKPPAKEQQPTAPKPPAKGQQPAAPKPPEKQG